MKLPPPAHANLFLWLPIVSNAGCRDNDIALMTSRLKEMQGQGQDVGIQFVDDKGLVAFQGNIILYYEYITSFYLFNFDFLFVIINYVQYPYNLYTLYKGIIIKSREKNVPKLNMFHFKICKKKRACFFKTCSIPIIIFFPQTISI